MMTQAEAVEVLEGLLISVQKFRSNTREAMSNSLGDLATMEQVDDMCIDMYPWMFNNDKNVLVGIRKSLDIYRNTGTLEPMTMRNFLVIAHRLQPQIAFAYHMWMADKLPTENDVPYLDWE